MSQLKMPPLLLLLKATFGKLEHITTTPYIYIVDVQMIFLIFHPGSCETQGLYLVQILSLRQIYEPTYEQTL